MKNVKRSIAVVIYGEGRDGVRTVLAVRRPPDDVDLPGIWGLPAASLREGEDWKAAVLRAGSDKLGVRLALVGELGEGTLERPGHLLHMRLVEAQIAEGVPDVGQPCEGVTRYVDWKWAEERELAAGARQGSLCCRMYLREIGMG